MNKEENKARQKIKFFVIHIVSNKSMRNDASTVTVTVNGDTSTKYSHDLCTRKELLKGIVARLEIECTLQL